MENNETLYFLHREKIYTLALRMTGNVEDAEDITQETFLSAFQSIHQFKGKSQIYTWLYQIAKNICLRFLEKRKKSSFQSLHELSEKSASTVSDELTEEQKNRYIAQVKDGCLAGLLRCLSIHQRIAFILNVILDVAVEDLASILEKSENATRILIHRSRQNIIDYLCCHCSLYNSLNPCKCENLINFSLKQGWISSTLDKEDLLNTESEIKELKNIVSLYKTLNKNSPSEACNSVIKEYLSDKGKYLISGKKK